MTPEEFNKAIRIDSIMRMAIYVDGQRVRNAAPAEIARLRHPQGELHEVSVTLRARVLIDTNHDKVEREHFIGEAKARLWYLLHGDFERDLMELYSHIRAMCSMETPASEVVDRLIDRVTYKPST